MLAAPSEWGSLRAALPNNPTLAAAGSMLMFTVMYIGTRISKDRDGQGKIGTSSHQTQLGPGFPAMQTSLLLPSQDKHTPCLFLYDMVNQVPLDFRTFDKNAVDAAEGWVYGAKVMSFGTEHWAHPTGARDDIIKGKLGCWQDSSFVIIMKYLDETWQAKANTAVGVEEMTQNPVLRGRVSVVLKDGSSANAWWYYKPLAETTSTAVISRPALPKTRDRQRDFERLRDRLIADFQLKPEKLPDWLPPVLEKDNAIIESVAWSNPSSVRRARLCRLQLFKDSKRILYAETLVIYPSCEYESPIFGFEWMEVRGKYFGAIDFHPLRHDRQYLHQYVDGYLGDQPNRSVTASKHYNLDLYFSHKLYLNKSNDDFYPHFSERLYLYLNRYKQCLTQSKRMTASKGKTGNFCSLQKDYDDHMGDNDPAYGILKNYYSSEFAEDYIKAFLFPAFT